MEFFKVAALVAATIVVVVQHELCNATTLYSCAFAASFEGGSGSGDGCDACTWGDTGFQSCAAGYYLGKTSADCDHDTLTFCQDDPDTWTGNICCWPDCEVNGEACEDDYDCCGDNVCATKLGSVCAVPFTEVPASDLDISDLVEGDKIDIGDIGCGVDLFGSYFDALAANGEPVTLTSDATDTTTTSDDCWHHCQNAESILGTKCNIARFSGGGYNACNLYHLDDFDATKVEKNPRWNTAVFCPED